jgi:hypothetical protein
MTSTSAAFELEPQQPSLAAQQAAHDFVQSATEERPRFIPNAVWLDDCRPFETFVVITSRNVYDIVVLPGNCGQVLIRGGHYFPEFRYALLLGATGGGSALKMNRIEVGLRMELRLDDKTVTTSRVRSLTAVR